MLKSFRNASQGLFIKILFGAIIFSFCLWGVGDIIKNYSASKPVFSVENTKITAEQFLREYSQEKQRIRNNAEKQLSDKDLKKLDIKGLVLDRLIQGVVLEQTYHDLNITVPQKSLINIIQSLPEFQNNGQFDDRIYEASLKRSGINETGFLMQIRDNVARTQLFHPIIAGYKIPEFIRDNIAKGFEAKKTIFISRIKINELKINENASDEELKQYYDNNKDNYKKPELRNISLLIIDYKNLAKDLIINEDEINRYYETNKEMYQSKEKRDFERFVFEAREDADKAWNMLNRGTSSKEINKKFVPDIDTIKNCEISDFPETVGSELFDLKLKKTSSVYTIGGKFYLYMVVNINKAKSRSETEVKSEIKKSIQNEKMNSPEFYTRIKDIKNKIDDGFGSGKSIEQVSRETGMKFVDFKNFEKTTVNKELETIIPDKDTRSSIIETAFSTDELQASQTIDSKDSDTISYVVFVRSIEKESIPEFEKVKLDVKRNLILEKQDKFATEKIREITNKRLESSKEIAKMKGFKKFRFSKKDLLTNKNGSSTEVEKILKEIPNANAILNIISTLRNGESNHYKLSDNEYILVAVDHTENVDYITPEFKDVMSRYIDSGTANDIVAISMDAFKKRLKIKIDNNLLENITKTTDEHEENN